MDILLSAVEVVRRDPEDLEGCETLIVANYQRNNWLKVGAALLVIHDTALFKKSGADSFSNYISTKADFGFGPRQALRLLAATKLAKIFPPTIALPTSERQARRPGFQDTFALGVAHGRVHPKQSQIARAPSNRMHS
jgi:hypothetical protein